MAPPIARQPGGPVDTRAPGAALQPKLAPRGPRPAKTLQPGNPAVSVAGARHPPARPMAHPSAPGQAIGTCYAPPAALQPKSAGVPAPPVAPGPRHGGSTHDGPSVIQRMEESNPYGRPRAKSFRRKPRDEVIKEKLAPTQERLRGEYDEGQRLKREAIETSKKESTARVGSLLKKLKAETSTSSGMGKPSTSGPTLNATDLTGAIDILDTGSFRDQLLKIASGVTTEDFKSRFSGNSSLLTKFSGGQNVGDTSIGDMRMLFALNSGSARESTLRLTDQATVSTFYSTDPNPSTDFVNLPNARGTPRAHLTNAFINNIGSYPGEVEAWQGFKRRFSGTAALQQDKTIASLILEPTTSGLSTRLEGLGLSGEDLSSATGFLRRRTALMSLEGVRRRATAPMHIMALQEIASGSSGLSIEDFFGPDAPLNAMAKADATTKGKPGSADAKTHRKNVSANIMKLAVRHAIEGTGTASQQELGRAIGAFSMASKAGDDLSGPTDLVRRAFQSVLASVDPAPKAKTSTSLSNINAAPDPSGGDRSGGNSGGGNSGGKPFGGGGGFGGLGGIGNTGGTGGNVSPTTGGDPSGHTSLALSPDLDPPLSLSGGGSSSQHKPKRILKAKRRLAGKAPLSFSNTSDAPDITPSVGMGMLSSDRNDNTLPDLPSQDLNTSPTPSTSQLRRQTSQTKRSFLDYASELSPTSLTETLNKPTPLKTQRLSDFRGTQQSSITRTASLSEMSSPSVDSPTTLAPSSTLRRTTSMTTGRPQSTSAMDTSNT